MAPAGVTGVVDGRTEVAVIAFQKWSGLPRNGVLDAATAGALLRATRPEPMLPGGAGRRVEVLLQRQVALLIEDDKVEHVVHISTGAAGRSTPVRFVPRVPQGAVLVVGSVQGVDAVGELLHGRHRVPRVRIGSDLLRPPTAAYGSTATTRWSSMTSPRRGHRCSVLW